ncbi:MAG: TetR/AcrR family transcriptional regulator [Actinomycetales bacterium]|nr:TetR/AcrR family transcriptional regulator [Actinomycetales bacterium]
MTVEHEPQERALPRGPHGLTRAEVEESQRDRLMWAIAEAVAEKGYNATTVADVISRAKVSRTTFYQLFNDKLACFLAANLAASELLIGVLDGELKRIDAMPDMSARARFDLLLSTYLDSLTGLASFAKVFLVEVYAAGAPAVAQRRELLGKFVELVVESRWGFDEGHLTETELKAVAEVVVAAVSLHATTALAVGDIDGIASIKDSLGVTLDRILGEQPTS